jgi:predicted RNA-binding Zn-ribbon protein involved in translation (DUF1610 family)
MLFLTTVSKKTIMGKTACKKKNHKEKENAQYECKRCGAKVKKEDKVCKPKKIK